MNRLKMGLCAGLCAALLTTPAFAEKADREKPVNLEADSVTLDDIRKISVYQGNVILSQGTLMLRADQINVTQNERGLDKLNATGRPVMFRQKVDGRDEFVEGFADRIEFDSPNSQLELVGQARLRRNGDELRGERISYNADTEFYKVVGQPDSRAPAGRVRAVIRPKAPANQPDATP